jgi:TonB-dependent starch-binding outer membrane protein SusC
MNWAKSLSTTALLLLFALPLAAQNGRITGTVADSVTGSPVIGAAVSVVGTSLVVVTSSTGQYSIS